MKLYLSQPRGWTTNLPRQIQRVAKLYRQGFLNDESSVWVNTNVVSPIFWTFNGIRATCIYWFDAPTTGTVRLTNGPRIRWGATHEESNSAAHIDLHVPDLKVFIAEAHLTFVVDHHFQNPEAPVRVFDGSTSKLVEGAGGFHEHGSVAVLDLPRYDSAQANPELSPSRLEYERGKAAFHGVNLLGAGMNEQARTQVLNNTDDYLFELTPPALGHLCESLEAFDVVADTITSHLFSGDHIDTASTGLI